MPFCMWSGRGVPGGIFRVIFRRGRRFSGISPVGVSRVWWSRYIAVCGMRSVIGTGVTRWSVRGSWMPSRSRALTRWARLLAALMPARR